MVKTGEITAKRTPDVREPAERKQPPTPAQLERDFVKRASDRVADKR